VANLCPRWFQCDLGVSEVTKVCLKYPGGTGARWLQCSRSGCDGPVAGEVIF
jgi:hypothetical protein